MPCKSFADNEEILNNHPYFCNDCLKNQSQRFKGFSLEKKQTEKLFL